MLFLNTDWTDQTDQDGSEVPIAFFQLFAYSVDRFFSCKFADSDASEQNLTTKPREEEGTTEYTEYTEGREKKRKEKKEKKRTKRMLISNKERAEPVVGDAVDDEVDAFVATSVLDAVR